MVKILSKKIEKRKIFIAGSPPDIDGDYESKGRARVKEYFIKKYGFNQVAYIGTCGEIKIASALQDFLKLHGGSAQEAFFLTSLLPKKQTDEIETVIELFKYANETPKLKELIRNDIQLIEDVTLSLGSFRNVGIHAGGVVVTPEYDEDGNRMEVWDWFPCEKRDGYIISQFDKNEIEAMGFLKNDILSIAQADEIKECFRIIKETTGKEYNFENIPLDDEKVFWMFEKGYTKSVFQFSGDSMTAFVMDMKPNKIDDLIAANALYRPGSMNSGMHKTYVDIKNGKKLPEYIWGLEEITKETYSVTCYQEQILKISQEIGGLSMAEADNLRRAISKKQIESMRKYKDAFIKNALDRGCPKEDADRIWGIIEDNADYSFNKAHSACYAITGYVCMYLKAHYPTQFYSTTLYFLSQSNKKDKMKMISKIIAEINRLGEVKVSQPDINESGERFKPNYDKKRIYWSLVSVKWVGEKAVAKIIEEREKNGKFFSVKDLFDRVDKRTVNKRAITNLILAGAFDEIYDIKQESDRIKILKEYYTEIIEEDLPEEFKNQGEIWKNHFWILLSLNLTGLGYINYDEIIKNSSFSGESNLLINLIRFNQDESIGQECILAGVIDKVIERKSKRGVFVQLNISHNAEEVHYTMWNETYVKYRKQLKNSEKSIILAKGIIKHDNWKKCNVVHSNDDSRIEII